MACLLRFDEGERIVFESFCWTPSWTGLAFLILQAHQVLHPLPTTTHYPPPHSLPIEHTPLIGNYYYSYYMITDLSNVVVLFC